METIKLHQRIATLLFSDVEENGEPDRVTVQIGIVTSILDSEYVEFTPENGKSRRVHTANIFLEDKYPSLLDVQENTIERQKNWKSQWPTSTLCIQI